MAILVGIQAAMLKAGDNCREPKTGYEVVVGNESLIAELGMRSVAGLNLAGGVRLSKWRRPHGVIESKQRGG